MRGLPFFIALIISGLYLKASKNDCSEIDERWNSEEEAISIVENTRFHHSESINLEKDILITSMHYFSCDKKTGHLIVKSMEETFFHENVPFTEWCSLKNAKSIGNYYNIFIRHNYKLKTYIPIMASDPFSLGQGFVKSLQG